MPDINDMGRENATQGICGFTSTLYAVYENQAALQTSLEGALTPADRRTRLMAEIKGFLLTLQANGKQAILTDIRDLTRTFPGYGNWDVTTYIAGINAQNVNDYSIAMPPQATVEYMRTAWDLNPQLETWIVRPNRVVAGGAILGLTKRTNPPRNRWKNLAHYVYQSGVGTIYSWGQQFNNLANLNALSNTDFEVIYRIRIAG